MSFLDRLLGRTPAPPPAGDPPRPASPAGHTPADPDQQAIARYQYLLRTAPPEELERAHAEAFATLTPAQRQDVLRALSDSVPPSERPTSDEPAALARMATRAEMREPGTMERTFAGPGMGSMFMGTLAGAFIGSAVAQSLFGGWSSDTTAGASDGQADVGDTGGGNDGSWDAGDAGGYDGGDTGGFGGFGDFGGGDFGGGE